jgi:hypothetical protein
MKKALQEQNLILQDGQLVGWGTANDVKNVLKSANDAVVSEEIRKRGKYKEVLDMATYEWLERIDKDGASKQIIADLNKPISHIEYRRALMHSNDGPPFWRQVAIENDDLRHPQLKAIYVISHLLAMGAFKYLKRCCKKDCQKFFIGPPNKKWCSKSCGSHFRVLKKRKNDKS